MQYLINTFLTVLLTVSLTALLSGCSWSDSRLGSSRIGSWAGSLFNKDKKNDAKDTQARTATGSGETFYCYGTQHGEWICDFDPDEAKIVTIIPAEDTPVSLQPIPARLSPLETASYEPATVTSQPVPDAELPMETVSDEPATEETLPVSDTELPVETASTEPATEETLPVSDTELPVETASDEPALEVSSQPTTETELAVASEISGIAATIEQLSMKSQFAENDRSADLLASPETSYAIQLIALQQLELVLDYAQQVEIENPMYARIVTNGEDWYLLLLGVYPDYEAAETALSQWNNNYLLTSEPWIRNLAPLQESIRLFQSKKS